MGDLFFAPHITAIVAAQPSPLLTPRQEVPSANPTFNLQ
jgi:hypothetical protein